MLDGSNANGYRLLWNRMQNDKVQDKKTMSGILKWGIGLFIVGIIAYAFFSGSVF